MGFIFDCLHPNLDRTCPVCGKSFRAKQNHQIYCCFECSKKDTHDKYESRSGKGSSWAEKHWLRSSYRNICPMCGALTANNLGCCREHQAERVKEIWEYGTYEAEELIRRGIEINLDESEGNERKLYERLLKKAHGKADRNPKSCYRKLIKLLKQLNYQKKTQEKTVCPICKKLFNRTHFNQVYCSHRCYRKHQNNSNKARNKVRRRCRLFSVQYDSSIRPVDVFVRDRWICQLCGRKTNKKHIGKLDPDAPTVDHIVPLSRGGGHLWTNVQCACRRCNYLKNDGDRVPKFVLEPD